MSKMFGTYELTALLEPMQDHYTATFHTPLNLSKAWQVNTDVLPTPFEMLRC